MNSGGRPVSIVNSRPERTSAPLGDQSAHLLSRVLRSEVNVASLLGFLAARDPLSLQSFLVLPEPISGVRVEVPFGKRSRLDVVLDGDRGPIAVLELKVSATEHGDQLSRYDRFASEYGAAKYLVDLELSGSGSAAGWTQIDLAGLFECWTNSADPTTTAFGTEISMVFRQWQSQALGPMGSMDPAMLPVVLRAEREALNRDRILSYATGTSAGQPSLVAFAPHPSGTDRAHLCVDIRCRNKNDLTAPWLLRLGVHVDESDDLPSDRRLAHELASQLEPALDLAKMQAWFSTTLPPTVTDSISGVEPLKKPRGRDAAIDDWLRSLDEAGSGPVARHPVFHHDWGRRLSAQFSLKVGRVTAADLGVLTRGALTYLADNAW
ncbi:MAG: hypothetical protein DI630_09345 [Gordonia sp. (in: high G+C Gram-positive bacteria)]|nr:MAG: hypothetical protein DI630_09345 [Gordonia sp. (in: high G+C Gram-positive bacteria)]